jgi:hypothetical protein
MSKLIYTDNEWEDLRSMLTIDPVFQEVIRYRRMFAILRIHQEELKKSLISKMRKFKNEKSPIVFNMCKELYEILYGPKIRLPLFISSINKKAVAWRLSNNI